MMNCDLAASGKLREPGVLAHRCKRMLADPRADSLVTNFAEQWLFCATWKLRTPTVSVPRLR